VEKGLRQAAEYSFGGWEGIVNRKQKRDAKNAKHKRNERRRAFARILKQDNYRLCSEIQKKLTMSLWLGFE
jgi:hypothetical protein